MQFEQLCVDITRLLRRCGWWSIYLFINLSSSRFSWPAPALEGYLSNPASRSVTWLGCKNAHFWKGWVGQMTDESSKHEEKSARGSHTRRLLVATTCHVVRAALWEEWPTSDVTKLFSLFSSTSSSWRARAVVAHRTEAFKITMSKRHLTFSWHLSLIIIVLSFFLSPFVLWVSRTS